MVIYSNVSSGLLNIDPLQNRCDEIKRVVLKDVQCVNPSPDIIVLAMFKLKSAV